MKSTPPGKTGATVEYLSKQACLPNCTFFIYYLLPKGLHRFSFHLGKCVCLEWYSTGAPVLHGGVAIFPLLILFFLCYLECACATPVAQPGETTSRTTFYRNNTNWSRRNTYTGPSVVQEARADLESCERDARKRRFRKCERDN